jgi:hypothetical protein
MRFTTACAGGVLTLALVAGIGAVLAQKGVPPKTDAEKAAYNAWKYPGAKERASGGIGNCEHALLTTNDDLDQVVAYYEKKTGQKLSPDAPGGSGGGSGPNDDLHVFHDDSVQPDGTTARPVVVRVFTQRAKRYDVTLVISRAKGEEHTHVSLTYTQK